MCPYIPIQLKPHSRKVLFLGAGASVDAGYPKTKNLRQVLESYYKDFPDIIMYKEAWGKFNATINRLKKNYPEFSDCDNLEYLMTILSLGQRFHRGKSIPTSIADLKQNINKLIKSSKTASEYEEAKNCFARCIEEKFRQINDDMCEKKFSYLEKLLDNEFKDNDTIITTNYDLLVERCLRNIGLWNIHDGYGFDIYFKDDDIFLESESNNEIKKDNSKKSKVKILKLHGSVGWLNGSDKIVIDTTRMQHLVCQGWVDINYSPTIYRATYNRCIPAS